MARHSRPERAVTKIFTSVLMPKLAEADLLELEDTLDTFGFEFTHASEISIRQLLHHTSGLADYQNDPGFRSANQVDPKRVWTPQELVDHALALGPVATPGQLHCVVGDTSPLDTTDLYHASRVWSSGALVCTVDDLRGWLHTLLSADFLLPESQHTATTEP